MGSFLPRCKWTYFAYVMIGLLGLTWKFNVFNEQRASTKHFTTEQHTLHFNMMFQCGNMSIPEECDCLVYQDGMVHAAASYMSCSCGGHALMTSADCPVLDDPFSCEIGHWCDAATILSWDTDEAIKTERWCASVPCREWSHWTNCSKSCGGGKQERFRECAVFEYTTCSLGSFIDSSTCNTNPCPEWSQWSHWSQCTATCNSVVPGYRTRTRACPESNSCGEGRAFETDPKPCGSNVTCPQWSQWEEWSHCSRTCGRGDRTRHRNCTSPTPESVCLGSGTQMDPCVDAPCPFVSYWAGWSPCTTTCGGGVKTRSRVTCPEGPPVCPLQAEEEKCNEQACPQWSNWHSWLECSKTCGGGQRVRRRQCPIDRGCVGKVMQIDRVRCNNFECPTTLAPPLSTTDVDER